MATSLASVAAALVFLPGVAGANSAPSTPDGVTAELAGTTITVSWNASSDPDGPVDGYNIYLDDDYTATVKGQTFHTEEVAGRSGTLVFQVTAFDNGDPQGFSPMSEKAVVDLGQQANRADGPTAPSSTGEIDNQDESAEPQVPQPLVNQLPVAPASVTASSDGEQVTVRWTAGSVSSGSVGGYNVYRNDSYVDTVAPDKVSWSEPIGNLRGLVRYSIVTHDDSSPPNFSPSSIQSAIDVDNGPVGGREEPGPEIGAEIDSEIDRVFGPDAAPETFTDLGTGAFSAPLDFQGTLLSRSEIELRWQRPTQVDIGIDSIFGWNVGYNIYRDESFHVTIAPSRSDEIVYIDDIAGLEGAHTYYLVPFVRHGGETYFGDRTTDLRVGIPLTSADAVDDSFECPSGRTKNLIVAGDSWAARVGPFLDKTFTNRGWRVHQLGVGSTLSRDWLPGTANYQTVASKLAAGLGDCSDNVVSFSAGGNDLVLPEGGANAFPQTEQDVEVRLGGAAQNIIVSIDAMRTIDPNVRIVMPGYDLLNPTVTAACLTAANVIAGQPGVPFDPAQSNDRQKALRNMYLSISRARPDVETPNLLGTMQGRPGNPDFRSLPPVVYSSADCIHLTGGPGLTGAVAQFEEPFGFNGYDIWGSELAMVIDPTLSLTYRLDLSPDAPAPELEDPFGEPLIPEGGIPQDVIVFEAENYTTRNDSGWGRGGATGAVGVPAINTVVSLAGPETTRVDGARLSYEIPITTAGSYDLWIRRRATTNSKDQLTWGFDGVQQPGEGLGGSIGSNFTWVYLGPTELSAGTRVLDFGRLEGELVLDRIALVRPGIMPLGDGGPANLVPRRAVSTTAASGNSLTIDYNKLFVADAGEEGGLQNGDEPRLVVIEFRTTPGVRGSTTVTNSFRYDGPKGRDDGDTWMIPDNIGRYEYQNFVAVNEVDVRAGSLPELIGHVAILLEDEPGSSSPVRKKIQDVADELQRAIEQIIEPLDPVTVAADPAGLAERITEASGLVTDAADPYDNPGISDTLESAVRDIGGADVVGFFPMFFLSVDESLVAVIDSAFAEQLQGVAAAGGSLRDRSFQFRRRGSGATYVVDVEIKVGN